MSASEGRPPPLPVHFLRHGWPLLLIVLAGIAAAAAVLNLTVLAN